MSDPVSLVLPDSSPLVIAASNLQLVSFCDVAVVAVLTYDTLLNIDEEYRHIWKTRWSLVKFLYLWTRYSTFVDATLAVHLRTHIAVHQTNCRALTIFDRSFAVAGLVVTEVILTVRTYALYGQSKRILGGLLVMWFAIGGVNIWAMIQWATSLAPIAMSPPTLCNLDSSTNAGLACYASLLVGETVIVLLTIWQGFQSSSFSRQRFRLGHSRLVTTFYRDGLLFYLAMFLILLVDVSLEGQARPGLKFTADVVLANLKRPPRPLRTMQSILACHLVIHAREVAWRDLHQEEDETMLDTLS
ncbi:hypothetical protein C8R43DRAFT_1004598 [Mycena crocata]|nr:hypothetical protein C8R43DRAFT_1004598 [Mycena crocata]